MAAASEHIKFFPADKAHLFDLRSFVIEQGEAAGLDESALHNLVLAVDEAATNVISHAATVAPHDISCKCLVDTDTKIFICELAYRTEEFSVPTTPPSDADIKDRILSMKRGGLGVYLMHQLVDGINYLRTGDQNVIRLIQKL